MRSIVKNFRNVAKFKSEVVLRTMPKFSDSNMLEQGYMNYLAKSNDIKEDKGLFYFSKVYFLQYSRSSIDKLLKFTCQLLKSKGALDTDKYNKMLRSYIIHSIDLDVKVVLNDMNNYGIHPNDETFALFVEICSNEGDITSAHTFMDRIQDNIIKHRLKQFIYAGYIRARLSDKAKQYLNIEKIDTKSPSFLKEMALAYAFIGDFNSAMNAFKSYNISNKDSLLAIDIYVSLLQKHTPESQLNQIIDHFISPNEDHFSYLIFTLNRNGYYANALKIMLNNADVMKDRHRLSKIAVTFSANDCPFNVYKTFIIKFSEILVCHSSILFMNMPFSTAYKLCVEIIKKGNTLVLSGNLLNNAIKEKSWPMIIEVLRLARRNMPGTYFASFMEISFVPLLLESDIIATPEDIIQSLPEFRLDILEALFMHFLTHGDFASFQSLLEANSMKPRRYENFSPANVKRILENMNIMDLSKLRFEMSKVFDPRFIDWLSRGVVLESIVRACPTDDVYLIKQSLKIAKSLNLTFHRVLIDGLARKLSQHKMFLQQLKISDNSEEEPSIDI